MISAVLGLIHWHVLSIFKTFQQIQKIFLLYSSGLFRICASLICLAHNSFVVCPVFVHVISDEICLPSVTNRLTDY